MSRLNVNDARCEADPGGPRRHVPTMTDPDSHHSSPGTAGGRGDVGPAGRDHPTDRRQWAIAGGSRRVLAVVAGLLLAMAAAFAAVVAANPARPPTASLDRDWASLIRPTRDVVLTDLAKVLSYVGGPLGGSIIAVAVALFLWFVRKRRVAAVFLAITPAVTSGASLLIKHLVLRARPSGGLVTADVGSFPSGHVITTLAVGLALTLVLVRPGHRRLPLVAVAAATLVMIWCRTYLGVHWLSDTLESILVAGGIVLALWAIMVPRIEREAAGTTRSPGF
jgi:membrane-associated phospholipid phosphatase